MSTKDNITVLQRIVADQRKTLQETVNPNLGEVPQVWALYAGVS